MRSYPEVSDWTTGIGGSISSPSAGVLLMNGRVNPSSFLTGTTAYQIEMTIEGQATFTIDAKTYRITTSTQEIELNANTVDFGQETKVGQAGFRDTADVYIRVTPTHAYLLVFGNYSLDSGGHAYGMLTIARSSPAPNNFTVDWASATVTNFMISDSTVVVSQDEVIVNDVVTTPREYSTRCWIPPTLTCPYTYIEQITKSHKYQDDPVGEQMLPVVTFSDPYDPSDLVRVFGQSPDWLTARVLACNLLTDETNDYQTSGLGLPACAWGAVVKRWYDGLDGYASETACALIALEPGTFIKTEYTHDAFGGLELDWGDETIAQPYPVPEFSIYFTVIFSYFEYLGINGSNCSGWYVSGGTTYGTVAVNLLSAGFSITVTGTEQDDRIGSDCSGQATLGIVGGTWVL